MMSPRSTRTIRQLNDLYTGCMNCPNGKELCPGVWKDIPRGVPPRGFYFVAAPVKILAVAKNPGHPLKSRPGIPSERDILKGKAGSDLLRTYWAFQQPFRSDPGTISEGSGTFAKNLLRYLAFFLDVPPEDVYQHAATTNLVKCSTPGERDKLEPKTMRQCYEQYFKEEILLLRPKVLLALGREVEGFLIDRTYDHGLTVVYVKHPSYFYRRDEEAAILAAIRDEIQQAINR